VRVLEGVLDCEGVPVLVRVLEGVSVCVEVPVLVIVFEGVLVCVIVCVAVTAFEGVPVRVKLDEDVRTKVIEAVGVFDVVTLAVVVGDIVTVPDEDVDPV
jgi:hypothetical protein